MATIINNLPKGNVKAPQGATMKINTGEQLHDANFDNNTEFVLEFTPDNLDPNGNPVYVRNGIAEDEIVIGRKAGAIQVEYNMPNIPLEGEKMNFYYDCGAPFSIDTIFTKYPLQAQQIECYFKVWNQEDKVFQESQSLIAQYAFTNTVSYIYTMKNGLPLVWYIDIKEATPAEDLTSLGENMTTAMWGSGSSIISPGRYLLYSSDGQYLYRFKLNAQTESLSNTSLEFLSNQIKLQGQVSYEDPQYEMHIEKPTISLFPEVEYMMPKYFTIKGDQLRIDNSIIFNKIPELSSLASTTYWISIADNSVSLKGIEDAIQIRETNIFNALYIYTIIEFSEEFKQYSNNNSVNSLSLKNFSSNLVSRQSLYSTLINPTSSWYVTNNGSVLNLKNIDIGDKLIFAVTK